MTSGGLRSGSFSLGVLLLLVTTCVSDILVLAVVLVFVPSNRRWCQFLNGACARDLLLSKPY